MDLKRDDGTPVEVEFQYRNTSASSCEVNILTAWLKSDNDVDIQWTTEEGERWEAHIAEHFEPPQQEF